MIKTNVFFRCCFQVAHMRKDQVYLTTTLHNHKQYQASVCGKALEQLQRVVVQQQ